MKTILARTWLTVAGDLREFEESVAAMEKSGWERASEIFSCEGQSGGRYLALAMVRTRLVWSPERQALLAEESRTEPQGELPL